jgi:hypothetical protein
MAGNTWRLIPSRSAIDEAGAWGAGSSPQYLDNFASDKGPQSQSLAVALYMVEYLRVTVRSWS